MGTTTQAPSGRRAGTPPAPPHPSRRPHPSSPALLLSFFPRGSAGSAAGIYAHLAYGERRPCVAVRGAWEDTTWRLLHANFLRALALGLQVPSLSVFPTANQFAPGEAERGGPGAGAGPRGASTQTLPLPPRSVHDGNAVRFGALLIHDLFIAPLGNCRTYREFLGRLKEHFTGFNQLDEERLRTSALAIVPPFSTYSGNPSETNLKDKLMSSARKVKATTNSGNLERRLSVCRRIPPKLLELACEVRGLSKVSMGVGVKVGVS